VWTWVSDLEGRWDRLVSFCYDNPGIRLIGDDLVPQPGWQLVFGGDVFDRGPAGRRLAAALVRAADRHPAQVVLLAGNRDLNKLRLRRELGPTPKAEHLQWILAHTMGAPHAFEHRRTELGLVSDEAVLASYLDDVAPDGVVIAYLARARLSFRTEDALFVHGGMPDDAWLRLPAGTLAPDLSTWEAEMAAWYASQLAAFADDPAGESSDPPTWWPIIAYQMPQLPSRAHRSSVIYGRNTGEGNNPALPAPGIRRQLLDLGLSHLVVGHTPNGDMPSFVRDPDGFALVVADASYPRSAVCPQLFDDGTGVRARGRVLLDDGRDLAARADLPEDDRLGRWHDGWLDKGVLETGERLVFRFEGQRFEQRSR
jgi:hypothetical protein